MRPDVLPPVLEDALRASWTEATCDPVDLAAWSPARPSTGQCAVTALVVQDHLGGELLLAAVHHADGRRQGVHYWNRLPDGREVDLTRDQFVAGERIGEPQVEPRPADTSRGRLAGQYERLHAAVGARIEHAGGPDRPAPRPASDARARAVLLDVDGTLLDTLPGLREVWRTWARPHGLDGDEVFDVALRGAPLATFAEVAPDLDPAACLAELHRIEDADAATGACRAFPGARELLEALPAGSWALVTSNYEHRVRTRFARAGLPAPRVVVDAEAVARGKPHPDGYVLAARLLGCEPARCLVLEDSAAGVRAATAAGMTAWAVDDPGGDLRADRSFATIAEAVPEVLRWLDARRGPDEP